MKTYKTPFNPEVLERRLRAKVRECVNHNIRAGWGFTWHFEIFRPEEIGTKEGQRINWEEHSPEFEKRAGTVMRREYLRNRKRNTKKR